MAIIDQLERYILKKELFLDSFIDHGSEQELFAAAYIRGHLDLVSANLINDLSTIPSYSEGKTVVPKKYTDILNTMLEAAIKLAIDNNELSVTDASDVENMLRALLQQ